MNELISYGFSEFKEPTDPLFKAISSGNIDELTKYYQKHGEFPPFCNGDIFGLYTICVIFKQAGSLCFLHKHGAFILPSDILTKIAGWKTTTVNHIQYLYENGFMWDKDITFQLIKLNNVAGLEYIHKQGCPLDKALTFRRISEYFHRNTMSIECLTYLHENGCDWDSDIMREAIVYGCYDKLKYLHEHGCPSPDIILTNNAMSGYMVHGVNVFGPYTHALKITPEIQMCLDYALTNKLVTIQVENVN